jgi:cytoskeletal protein RodZ
MGLVDGEDTRDGVHDRGAQPTAAAGKHALGWPWMVLVALVALLALYQAFSSFRPRPQAKAREAASQSAASVSAARAPSAAAAPTASAATGSPPTAAAPPSSPASASVATQAAPEVVTRCTEEGKTSFSDQPCAPGAQAQRMVVDPDQNLAQGLPRSQVENAVKGGPRAPNTEVAADAASLHQLQCDALAARIRAIDARQPATAQEQDRLAALRKDYRNEQLRKRC